MKNEQVAHLWANKSRTSAKGSSFYFEGDTIYSYGSHFPIARHYQGVILFTSKSYGVTTARHMNITRSACSHLTVFIVADVLRDPCKADLKDYKYSIERLATDAARARNPEFKLSELEREVNEANQFAETFGFKTRFSMPDSAVLETLKAKALIAQAKQRRITVERLERQAKEQAELLSRWLAGEQVSVHFNTPVHLRVKHCYRNGVESLTPADAVMQTTKGAEVPLAQALRAYCFVKSKRETGWRRNGDTFQVGDFQLDAVNEQGVIAGCHRIAWAEIERFAKAQGWA